MIVFLFLLTACHVIDCVQISCSRQSQKFKCHGIGKFSDTIEVCDLGHQICQYEDSKKPICMEKAVDAVICNSTDKISCVCDYNNNGFPFCACAERGTLKQLTVYSWLGISACIALLLICAGIFIYRFSLRRKKRLDRSSAPLDEDGESPPPSYQAAVGLIDD